MAVVISFFGLFYAFPSSSHAGGSTSSTSLPTSGSNLTAEVMRSAGGQNNGQAENSTTEGLLAPNMSTPDESKESREIVDWCDPSLNCGDKMNLLCYPLISFDCTLVEYELDRIQRAKLIVLGAINTFRDRLASGQLIKDWPTAANMRQLVFDDILEIQAATVILTCTARDNPCPVHQLYGHDVGQTYVQTKHWVAKDTAPVSNVHAMVLEIHQASKSIVDHYEAGEAYKNFAHIAFAEARIIGCAMIRYNGPCEAPECYMLEILTLVIEPLRCNVAPMPKAGFELYEKGEPCTKCPNGTACNPNSTYKYLCAASGDTATGPYVPLSVFSNDFQDQSKSLILHGPASALLFTSTLLMMLLTVLMTHNLDPKN